MSAFEEYMNMSSEAYEAGGPEFYKDNLIEEGYASGFVDGAQQAVDNLLPWVICGVIGTIYCAIGWCITSVKNRKEKKKSKNKNKSID